MRHGETEYAKQKRYIGHTDCSLSEKGVFEAEQIGQYFFENRIIINHIFSSDLKRCKTTVNAAFPKRKVTFLKELREINMGMWDGLTFDEIKSKYPEDFKKRGENISEFIPPQGESFKECEKRAAKIFEFILSSTDGNVVICSHAGFNRAIISKFLNQNINNIFNIKQDYGCINIIASDKTNIMVEAINLKKI